MEEEILTRLASLNLGDVATTSAAAQPVFSRDQLKEIVKVVTQTLAVQNSEDQTVDPTPIDFTNATSVAETEKIPDAVKSLREFSGNPEEFSSWRKSVDRILEMYQSLSGTPKYYAILHLIRHKIVGNADIALESYRTPLDWQQIKKCLMMHYSDKRDISTLEYQMSVMTQRNDSVNVFYQKVYQHLSLILNKVDCLNFPEATLTAMANAYRDKALDTFIRGLNGDLPRLLSIKEPNSLPQALHLCLKLDNMAFRMHHANTSHANHAPRLPPKPQQNRPIQYQRHSTNQPFYPELVHWPRPQNNFRLQNNNNPGFIRNNTPWMPARPQQGQFFQNTFRNQPNLPPKPQPPPVPMDVDRSLRSAQINYQNRPNNMNVQPFRQHPNSFPAVKRHASYQNVHPQKMQRNYHVYYEDAIPEEEYDYWYDNESYEDVEPIDLLTHEPQGIETEEEGPTVVDPDNLFENQKKSDAEKLSDNVNFLGHQALPYRT